MGDKVLFVITMTAPSTGNLPPCTNIIGHTDCLDKAKRAFGMFHGCIQADLAKKYQSVSVSNGHNGDVIFSCIDNDGEEKRFLLSIDESYPLGYSGQISGI